MDGIKMKGFFKEYAKRVLPLTALLLIVPLLVLLAINKFNIDTYLNIILFECAGVFLISFSSITPKPEDPIESLYIKDSFAKEKVTRLNTSLLWATVGINLLIFLLVFFFLRKG